eukprot:TRINITY_DN78555_c0_g1_i1.p1 TRINITY_DN78555_c0_g1~~TRINITY_DN78555_c0_g1_i1.p1  ORF type:complete len:250 (-),score=37.76 TRINITY_DN78555_c0_g1_i1:189-938(-)
MLDWTSIGPFGSCHLGHSAKTVKDGNSVHEREEADDNELIVPVLETDVPIVTSSEDMDKCASMKSNSQAPITPTTTFSDSDFEELAVSATSSNESKEPPQPDFTGKWICSRVEGDWEAFLRERGTSWTVRKIAASIGFGVGKQTQEISQDGDCLEVVNQVSCTHSLKEDKSILKADGLEQFSVDPEGIPLRQKTTWDGEVLVSEQCFEHDKQSRSSMIVKRYMKGVEMCTERVTASGLIVRRFYERTRS